MTYYLIIIGVVAVCVPLLVGLIVAARQRPSRHEQTLEHIDELEKQLGMGAPDQLNEAGRPSPTPEQIESSRSKPH